MSSTLYSVEHGTSAETVSKMLTVLYPDAKVVLDATWGKGRFWGLLKPPELTMVIGLDLSPHGRPSVVGDFTRLPFADQSVDVTIYDPPFLSDMSKHGTAVMESRFSGYRGEAEARETVQAGAREAWRVARLGIIVKLQDHTHNNRYVDMTGWIREALGQPLYGKVDQLRQAGKIKSPRWGDQLSVYSNSATFLAFRRGDQRHVRRGRQLRQPERSAV